MLPAWRCPWWQGFPRLTPGRERSASTVPAASELPPGLENGDLISDGGLIWFLWGNIKNRVWLPAAPPVYPVGASISGQLVGAADPRPELGAITITTSGNGTQIGQVYWTDAVAQVNYPVDLKMVSTELLDQIPTAGETQYFPVYQPGP